MRIDIPYGDTKIDIDIPDKNLASVITANISQVKKDETSIIKEALKNPVGSKRLSELSEGKRSAVILASDITRPSPSHRFLPYIIEELKEGGVVDIKVVLGVGIHRGHTVEEKKRLVGREVYSDFEVVDSNSGKFRLIGTTSHNTPVELFEGAISSDILVATGNIEYHYFAGYSGGAKAVMPGIASHTSISNNHSYMLCDNSCSANIKDNPVRKDIEEAAKMAGIDFIFNVILDDDKRIIDAVSGGVESAFLEGVLRYDKLFKKEISKHSDIVITSPGGYPKDINLYQSHKAIENVKEIVRPGGEIILLARCQEGFGEETFKKWMFKAKDYKRCKKDIEDAFVLGGHKAAAISKIMASVRLTLLSEFDGKVSSDIGFEKIDHLQNYLDKKISENSDTMITVVPTGRLVKKIG